MRRRRVLGQGTGVGSTGLRAPRLGHHHRPRARSPRCGPMVFVWPMPSVPWYVRRSRFDRNHSGPQPTRLRQIALRLLCVAIASRHREGNPHGGTLSNPSGVGESITVQSLASASAGDRAGPSGARADHLAQSHPSDRESSASRASVYGAMPQGNLATRSAVQPGREHPEIGSKTMAAGDHVFSRKEEIDSWETPGHYRTRSERATDAARVPRWASGGRARPNAVK